MEFQQLAIQERLIRRLFQPQMRILWGILKISCRLHLSWEALTIIQTTVHEPNLRIPSTNSMLGNLISIWTMRRSINSRRLRFSQEAPRILEIGSLASWLTKDCSNQSQLLVDTRLLLSSTGMTHFCALVLSDLRLMETCQWLRESTALS